MATRILIKQRLAHETKVNVHVHECREVFLNKFNAGKCL